MRRPIPIPRRWRPGATPRRGGGVYRWVLAALAGLLLVTLAGCSSAHDSLGTSDGGCFLALPTAGSAVHHHGRLLGARLVVVKDLRPAKDGLVLDTITDAGGSPARRVCLVAFVGRFSSSSVEHPVGAAGGRLAVAVIEYPDGRLLGTVVLSRLPDRFGHPHLG